MNEKQKEILNNIINIQILSLERIISQPSEYEDVLMLYNLPKKELDTLASFKISELKDTLKEPNMLYILDKFNIHSLMRILFLIENQYNPHDTMGIWELFINLTKNQNYGKSM